jgi:hypothetical protein
MGPLPFYYIKDNLNFGKVSIIKKKTTTNYIYVIYNIRDIYLICLLLNNNPIIIPFYKKIENIFIILNNKIIKLLTKNELHKIEIITGFKFFNNY